MVSPSLAASMASWTVVKEQPEAQTSGAVQASSLGQPPQPQVMQTPA